MKTSLKKVLSLVLCLVLSISLFTFVGCTQHVCNSVCQICGHCKNSSCNDAACKQKCQCSSVKDKDATIIYFEVSADPRTEYLPGEVFDITGLAVKVWLSNGKIKTYLDMDFTEWSHKGESLTEDVESIRVKLPGRDYTFDIDISVKLSSTAKFIVDGNSFEKLYKKGTVINLAKKAYCVDGFNVQSVSENEYEVKVNGVKVDNLKEYELTAVGNCEIVYSYAGLSRKITFTVYDKTDGIYPYVFESDVSVYKNQVTAVYDPDTGKLTDYIRGKETFSLYGNNYTGVTIQNEADGKVNGTSKIVGPFTGGTSIYPLGWNQGGMEAYFYLKATVAEEGDYDLMFRANVQSEQEKVSSFVEYCVNGTPDANGLYTYTRSTSDDLVYFGSQLSKYSSKYSTTAGYNSWSNLVCYTTARIATVHLNKGENIVKFRYIHGNGGFVDNFYLKPTTGTDVQENAVFAIREGVVVDLSGDNFITVNMSEKVSTYTKTSSDHLVQYTNIFYRFSNGFELNITEDMISGINYRKTGLQTATVKTGTFYGESATFTFNVLIVE